MTKQIELSMTTWAGMNDTTKTDYTVFKTHTGYVFVPVKQGAQQITMTQSDAAAFAKLVAETQEQP